MTTQTFGRSLIVESRKLCKQTLLQCSKNPYQLSYKDKGVDFQFRTVLVNNIGFHKVQ